MIGNISSIFLPTCINFILQNIAKENSTLLITNYEDIISFNYPPKVLYKPNASIISFTLWKADIYLINCTSYELDFILKNLQTYTNFQPNAYFILTVDEVTSYLFETLSKHYVYNVIAMTYTEENRKKLYTYQPFQFYNIEKPYLKPISRGFCHEFQLDFLLTKIPTRWKNASFVVSAGITPPFILMEGQKVVDGLDFNIADIIFQAMELKPRIFATQYPTLGLKVNRTYNGTLGYLQRKEADMIMGSVTISVDAFFDFQYSHPICVLFHKWVIPKTLRVAYWKRVFSTFKKNTWLTFSFLYLILFLITIASTCINTNTNFSAFVADCLSLLCIILGVSINIYKLKIRSKKIIFLCWSIFWMVVIPLFDSKLIFNLVVNIHEKKINDYYSLAKTDLKLCVVEGIKLNEKYWKKEKVEYCINCEICVNRTAFERDTATLRNYYLVIYDMPKFYTHNYTKSYLIDFIDEGYYNAFSNFVFQKNHPVFDEYDKIFVNLTTTGIVQKILSKYSIPKEKQEENQPEALTIQKLEFAFGLLLYGLGFAFIMFVFEVNFGKT